MDYAHNYSTEDIPSKWFIEETIRKEGLQSRKPKKRVKGGAEYLLYPTQSVRDLGHIHQSADFIGKKYITGKSEPINIFSTCYYAPFKIYQIKRILAEKAVYAIETLEQLWKIYPTPDIFRIDNGLQFRGTASGQRAIGKFLTFLLNIDITPLFGAPSKPWTNPNVEGHNRVFNEKVWNRNFFTSLRHIDVECERFNLESKELFDFKYSMMMFNDSSLFNYLHKDQQINTTELKSVDNKKVCFTRFVESQETSKDAQIVVMNELVSLSEKYSHQFVFVEWLLDKEQLYIYSEYKKSRTLIRKLKFEINF